MPMTRRPDRRWSAWFLVAALTVVAGTARADYLEVRRDVWLKKTPASDGEQLEKLEPTTLVALGSATQQNGYYGVTTRAGKHGFVYRTYVVRHPGALPPETIAP